MCVSTPDDVRHAPSPRREHHPHAATVIAAIATPAIGAREPAPRCAQGGLARCGSTGRPTVTTRPRGHGTRVRQATKPSSQANARRREHANAGLAGRPGGRDGHGMSEVKDLSTPCEMRDADAPLRLAFEASVDGACGASRSGIEPRRKPRARGARPIPPASTIRCGIVRFTILVGRRLRSSRAGVDPSRRTSTRRHYAALAPRRRDLVRRLHTPPTTRVAGAGTTEISNESNRIETGENGPSSIVQLNPLRPSNP